ncbi:MAG: hypothetical protein MUF14_06090 [Hyphomonadaceae bacterium]|jgi:hypothetical protein|nr:hypothetical protein [Hyphomonadaceae bacterium]
MPDKMKQDAEALLSPQGHFGDPSGEVALQLLYALFSALKGVDPVLDERLHLALDNCVAIAEQTSDGDTASGYSRVSHAILAAFRAGLIDEPGTGASDTPV